MNVCFLVSYDGTKYDGWQRQGNTDRTIQGKIEAVLHRLFDVVVETHGSGRTDGGVHAHGQVANFWIEEKMYAKAGQKLAKYGTGPQAIQAYLNDYLPEDICIRAICTMPERFHSRLSAVGKTYVYRIHTSQLKPVFDRKYVWWLPQALDVAAMRQAAELLTGTHDYASFCGNPKMKKSTVRTVDRIAIDREGDTLVLQFHGDGFLQNMVRILTGTLVEVGRGHLTPHAMSEILAQKKRTAAGPMAPAQGLWLEQVDYDVKMGWDK